MGFNYGVRRGRCEELRAPNVYVAYAIGTSRDGLKFSKIDEQSIYDVVNREIDRASARLQRGFDYP